jgi:hypothetical protein
LDLSAYFDFNSPHLEIPSLFPHLGEPALFEQVEEVIGEIETLRIQREQCLPMRT